MAKVVPLSRGYPAAKGAAAVAALEFRAPRWDDYFEVGPVSEWQQSPEGAPLLIRHQDRVANYAFRLCQTDGAQVVIPMLDLADSFAVEDAIMSFFSDARAKQSSESSTSSSGGSDGAPAT